jgi:hypothetical protein
MRKQECGADMSGQDYSEKIYLIFSITSTKIGKLIRTVTRYPYNHVSVALSPALPEIYSFARHYRKTPFYGGFVRESRLRYCNADGLAKIMICAIPVSQSQYEAASGFIKEVSENEKEYLYNIISAVFVPMRLRIFIDRAYTCLEFAVELLAHCGIEGAPDPNRFCSIQTLIEKYEKYKVYEGVFPDAYADSRDDCYEKNVAFLRRMSMTVSTNARLLGRFCRSLVR